MFLWLSIITVVFLSIWNAIRERARLPVGRWLVLVGLRLCGLGLLATALWGLDPWGAMISDRRPLVLAIVDGSRSMARQDGLDSTRFQRAMADARSLAERGDIRTRIYSGGSSKLQELGREPLAPLTDIAAWLVEARVSQPDAVILLSDGNDNSGGDPAMAAAGLGFPVYVFGYGAEDPGRMPAILDAWAPEYTGLAKPVEVKVRVKSGDRSATLGADGVGGPAVHIKLVGGEDKTITIRRTPDTPGIHRVNLYLATGADTVDRRTVVYRADKSKIRVVCLCGVPDWNLRFLRQAIMIDPDIELQTLVRQQGWWQEVDKASRQPSQGMAAVSQADLVMLMNFEPSELDIELEKSLIEASVKRGIPLLFMGGWWDDAFSSREIHRILPLRFQHQASRIQSRLEAAEGQFDRMLPDPRGPAYVSSIIKKMPPLWAPRKAAEASPAVSVIAWASDGKTKFPVWAWWYQGSARIAQLAVEDLWSWRLGAWAGGGSQGDTTLYGRLIRGLLRWMTGGHGQMVEVGPERSIYYLGEEVKFKGSILAVSDEARIAPAWTIRLELAGGRTISQRMIPWKPTLFQTIFTNLQPGAYRWTSVLSFGSKVIDRSQGRFWVEPSPGEMGGHIQQTGVLKKIAELSGGRYWDRHQRQNTASEIKDLRAVALRGEPRPEGLMSLVLFGLLAIMAEWFWRRRWGLK